MTTASSKTEPQHAADIRSSTMHGAGLALSTSAIDATALSRAAKARFEATDGQAFLLNDWDRAVFLHYEADPQQLQAVVPFELDLFRGRAFVSLVAFNMRHLRLRSGGHLINWTTCPLASHGFLNVRTYVKHQGETGIYFLAEWLPHRLSVLVGPRTFGLPFQLGTLDYHHDHERGALFGQVAAANPSHTLKYEIDVPADARYEPCTSGTIDEFLLERYTAFTKSGRTARRFRVWHEPWPQIAVHPTFLSASILRATGAWADDADYHSAHYSPGAADVWMSRPRCINGPACATSWPVDKDAWSTRRPTS